MTQKKNFEISDLRIGDILVEMGEFDDETLEIARYLIYDKLLEKQDYEVREMVKILYFKTYLLYVEKKYDNVWAKANGPGSTYYLSQYEITNHHDWIRVFKSPLPPIDFDDE